MRPTLQIFLLLILAITTVGIVYQFRFTVFRSNTESQDTPPSSLRSWFRFDPFAPPPQEDLQSTSPETRVVSDISFTEQEKPAKTKEETQDQYVERPTEGREEIFDAPGPPSKVSLLQVYYEI